MKNKSILFFLLLAAVIVLVTFTLASCSSVERGTRRGVESGLSKGISNSISNSISGGGGGSSGSSSSSNTKSQRTTSGTVRAVPWPADRTWSRYGLSGLKQPAGTTVTGASMIATYYVVALINGGQAAFDNLVGQIEKIPGSEQILESMTEEGFMAGFTVPGGIVNIIHEFDSDDITIQCIRE